MLNPKGEEKKMVDKRPSEMKVDELRTAYDQQIEVVDALKRTIVTLTDSLEKSEAVHRGELRGRLVKRIHDETILTPEDIVTMTENDMKEILDKVPLMKRQPFHAVSDMGGSAINARPSAKLENVYLFGPDSLYKNR